MYNLVQGRDRHLNRFALRDLLDCRFAALEHVRGCGEEQMDGTRSTTKASQVQRRSRIILGSVIAGLLVAAVVGVIIGRLASPPAPGPRSFGQHPRLPTSPQAFASASSITAIAYSRPLGRFLILDESGRVQGSPPGMGQSGGPTGAGRESQAVAIAASPRGVGYSILMASGAVETFGASPWLGSPTLPKGGSSPAVAIAATPGGRGYFVLLADGKVLGYGSAATNSMSVGVGDAVGMAVVNRHSYYVLGSDGAVYAHGLPWYGDARPRRGFMPPAPLTGIAIDQATGGYWLIAQNGAVYGFHAPAPKSPACASNGQAVVGIASTGSTYGFVTSGGSAAEASLAGGGKTSAHCGGRAWRAQHVFGFYPGQGNGPGSVAQTQSLDSWLGRPVGYVTEFLDMRSPSMFEGSAWGLFVAKGAMESLHPRPHLVISVPLGFGTGLSTPASVRRNLRAVAAGKYDAAYSYAADVLVESGYSNAVVRIGWEFDGTWYPWSARNDPRDYIRAYRHVVDLFRAASPAFTYDWCGTAQLQSAWPHYWPGSRYVDTVGMDVYDRGWPVIYNPITGSWFDRNAAWQAAHKALSGLESFAIRHGKRVSLPEWALTTGGQAYRLSHGGDNPTFIQGIYDWIVSLPAVGPGSIEYACYFNGTAPTQGSFEIDSFPKARHMLRRLFA